jgi:uncharacterized protein (TIGR00297 family)
MLFLLEKLSKIRRLSVLFTRKSVHLLVGLFIVIAISILDTVYPILILSAIFILFDWWAIQSGRFKSIHPDKSSYGTVFYPLAVFILSLILWNSSRTILIIAMLIMSVSDVAAAVAGERYAKLTFIPFKERKSIPGSATMFLSSFVIITTVLLFSSDFEFYRILIISCIVGIQVTAAEMISFRGSDNLSVPLITALFLFIYINKPQQIDFIQVTYGTIFALIAGISSYYLNFLKFSGLISVVIIGGVIFGFGGMPFTFPILFFFISSSFLSLFKKGYKQRFLSMFEKSGTRDISQVIANGGIPTILIVLSLWFRDMYIFPLYLTAVAAATADTWATELGVLSPARPRLITTFKSMEKGTSGAISLTGSIAAIFGSIITVLIGYYYHPVNGYPYEYFIIAAMCGIFSCFIDSYIGASVQAQFKCTICSRITEKKIHCHTPTVHFRGYSFIENDSVNIFSIFFAVILCLILIILFNN